MPLLAVLFDMDGVIVRTDTLHYLSWIRLTGEERIPFTENDFQPLRGLSRADSLGIVLRKAKKNYSPAEKEELARRKNAYYLELAEDLSEKDLLPGARDLIEGLRRKKIPVAVCSGSRNARHILKKLKLTGSFDLIITGDDLSRPKPDPEIFLKAAARLRVAPADCLVFEDAEAGVEAARKAGMKVVGVGRREFLDRADLVVSGLDRINPPALERLFE